MSHELNPEHAEVARTAWEKIHEHIMLRVGKAVVGAASVLDVIYSEDTVGDGRDPCDDQSI